MIYLLKITIAWVLFLLLFEALYKNNAKFTANRFYLLASMILGLLLPFIPLPAKTPARITAIQGFYTESVFTTPLTVHPATVLSTPEIVSRSISLLQIMLVIYLIGVIILLIKNLLEFSGMLLLIFKTRLQIIEGHKVIVTAKMHAPYSFMGRIFITDIALYSPGELEYILQHEAAHSSRMHWLDLWMIQCACIAFWFHPLIWRYRYLLQMQHEYQADQIAGDRDPYSYGHFLLQQTILNGVPSMAHSFHFSPIKNRINMLTKKRNQKKSTWKYLIILPVSLACTLLMAKAVAKDGSTMTYKRDVFKWRESDTLFYDEYKRRPEISSNPDLKRKIVYSMNNEAVYQNEYLKTPATYNYDKMHYVNYIKREFKKLCENTADSMTAAVITSLVINKEGKVVLYDVRYFKQFNKYMPNQWNPIPNLEPTLNSFMNKIIAEAPDWKPAMIDGKPVNSVINLATGEGC